VRITICLLLLTATASAQTPAFDPASLTRLQEGEALRVSSNNRDPNSNDDSLRPIAGETVTLADIKGPGVINHIWLTVAASEYGWPRLLRLRFYYDDSPIPSVDAPVGDFFGVGHGFERSINSVMVRNSSSGRSRNSYWQMPFAKRIRITVTNEGRRRVSNLYYHVDYRKLPSLPPDTTYFHARYRQALPTVAGRPYEIVSVSGQGHYVGTVLNIVQNEAGWFGEGDEHFYVDGGPMAVIEGTGTEDYFNDAWSFRVGDSLYTGVPVADGTGVGARLGAYRWHVVDPIPFRRSLRLDIEHAGWTYSADGSVRSAFEERADLFSSVAFWYQRGIANDQPDLPYGAARLPIGNAQQIEVEARADEVKVESGKASVQKDVFWSKDILLFEGSGPGAAVTIPFDVAADGRYELVVQLAHSFDYGAYVVELDGQSTAGSTVLEHEPGANAGGTGRIDAYFTETYVAEDHLIGWANLTRGRHTLRFVCVGRNSAATGHNFGIDTLILARLGAPPGADPSEARADAIRQVMARPPLTVDAVATLTRALTDDDHIVRGLAALGLRDAGTAAAPARDALVSRLKDDEVGVRMIAAQAIGRLADPSTLDALMAAGRESGQHVHVLRSVADALGALGPVAAPALALLKELAQQPRVRWAAEAAIGKIGR
jgi:hypothetical protein